MRMTIYFFFLSNTFCDFVFVQKSEVNENFLPSAGTKQNCDGFFFFFLHTSGANGKVINQRSNLENKFRYVFVICVRSQEPGASWPCTRETNTHKR